MMQMQWTVIVLMVLCAIGVSSAQHPVRENPLLGEFATPHGVPDFGKIKTAHFKPAFERAMKTHVKEIDAIAAAQTGPTFGNTIETLEYSGELLERVGSIFFNLNSTDTNPAMQKIAQWIAPRLAKHGDDIMLNGKLFRRVKAVYDRRKSLGLNAEQLKLTEETYLDFMRSGVALGADKRKRLRAINRDLSLLTLRFRDNVLAETRAFGLVIDDRDDLAGLPESAVGDASRIAEEMNMKGKWVFTLDKPSIFPFLQYSSKRRLREKMYRAYLMRCNNGNKFDNNKVISKIVSLRNERARILGFENHAAFVLERNMAKTPGKAYGLLLKLWDAALPKAKAEASAIREIIRKEGGTFAPEPWDWWYYAEKIRGEKYALDDETLRPYFTLEHVRDGAFLVANRLYGLEFRERKDIPRYHTDVSAYEVLDADGSHLGVLYLDFYIRSGKQGGAWCTNFRPQHRRKGKDVRPIVSMAFNFSRPSGDSPVLLNIDEVETVFHEFGHALHELLSDGTYSSLAGTSVPRDFVELPSQVMENWAMDPAVLRLYARHYKTGTPMPDSLIDKIAKSSHFNQGFSTVELVAAAILDMDYHTKADGKLDPPSFEKASMDRIGLIAEIEPRYRSTYFTHIFSQGYAAGYYSYIWSEVLDADAFEAFRETGDVFNKETAMKFRNCILSKGYSEEPMALYVKFRGREPSIGPLLKKRGLE